MPVETISVPEEARGRRIDQFLAARFADLFSRTKIKELILAGKVTVNGKRVKPNFLIFGNQEIRCEFEETVLAETRAEDIPIAVVYEDDDLLVVNKPAGMVVHPACGNLTGTLVNALLHYSKTLSKAGGDIRAGIIHRLDKDTSGLLVVAKNDAAHELLAHQFKHHQVEKVYWAVVNGVVEHDEMRSDAPLGRSLTNHRKIIVQKEGGRESLTHFKVLTRFQSATLLEVRPETGRTHQIRVHLKHLGYPALGDKEYGTASPFIDRQALHAKLISFVHPRTKKKLKFDSDLPEDFTHLLEQLSRTHS